MLRTSDHTSRRRRAPVSRAARRADHTEARRREPVGALTAFLVLPFVWLWTLASLTDDRSATPTPPARRVQPSAARAPADSLAAPSVARPRGATREAR
jgi:hypothetical protein